VKPEIPITPQTRTLAVDPCVNCHRDFFPLGCALENFDPLGRWRTSDQMGPVDASGAFVDGTPINERSTCVRFCCGTLRHFARLSPRS
jgi:hypothetical protein